MVPTAKLRPEKGPLRQSLYFKVGETRVFILGAELMNSDLLWP